MHLVAKVLQKKAYEQVSGYKTSVSSTTMILTNAQGVQNIRKIKIKKLESENGDRSLLSFLYPNDLKGTKLLSYEVIGGDDKQWLYLPALKRIKRISSRNKSGSFMASEFSYEDIASQNYKNYTYPCEAKSLDINGTKYFEIMRVPKDKNSGYSKQILYIEVDTFLTRYGKYYDKHNKLLKKISFPKYIALNGVQRVQKIVMLNIQNKKMSTLTWDDDKTGVKLSSKEFTKRALK